MGTETYVRTIFLLLILLLVKLNNPLMGTETWNLQSYDDKRYCRKVKLNNPLMGTETKAFLQQRFFTIIFS